MTVREIGKDTKIVNCITPVAGVAGTSDLNGAEVNMESFENVAFIFHWGVITASGVQSVKAQQDVVTGMAGAADLIGTNILVADDDDGEITVIDIIKPLEQFVRPVVLRATQNAVVSCVGIAYNGLKKPFSQAADVTVETHISPIEGTA